MKMGIKHLMLLVFLLLPAQLYAQEDTEGDSGPDVALDVCQKRYQKSLLEELTETEKKQLNKCMDLHFNKLIDPKNFLTHQTPEIPEYMFDAEKMKELGINPDGGWV